MKAITDAVSRTQQFVEAFEHGFQAFVPLKLDSPLDCGTGQHLTSMPEGRLKQFYAELTAPS